MRCDLQGIKPWSTAELPTTLTNKPNTQVKECYLYMSMKPFRSAEWWTCIFKWSKFQFPIFLFSKLRVSIYSHWISQSLFHYTDVHLCAKFGDLKPTNEQQHFRRKLQFSFHQMFYKCLSIIVINRLCCGKLENSSYASGATLPTLGTPACGGGERARRFSRRRSESLYA